MEIVSSSWGPCVFILITLTWSQLKAVMYLWYEPWYRWKKWVLGIFLIDCVGIICLPEIINTTVLIMHLFEHLKHTLVLVTVFLSICVHFKGLLSASYISQILIDIFWNGHVIFWLIYHENSHNLNFFPDIHCKAFRGPTISIQEIL